LNDVAAGLAEGEAQPASASDAILSAEPTPSQSAGGLIGFVVTSDVAGTALAVASDSDSSVAGDSEQDVLADENLSRQPATTTPSSRRAAPRVAPVDADELESELDLIAEELSGLNNSTSRDLLFAGLGR
jgi:hypothetical protein